MLTTDDKQKILSDYQIHGKDTGSAEAQTALFSEEITRLSKHLKKRGCIVIWNLYD